MKLKDLTGKDVVLITTEKKYIEFCKLLDKKGFKWCNGEKYVDFGNFNNYGNRYCICVKKGEGSSLGYYTREEYKVYSVDLFLKNNYELWEK